MRRPFGTRTTIPVSSQALFASMNAFELPAWLSWISRIVCDLSKSDLPIPICIWGSAPGVPGACSAFLESGPAGGLGCGLGLGSETTGGDLTCPRRCAVQHAVSLSLPPCPRLLRRSFDHPPFTDDPTTRLRPALHLTRHAFLFAPLVSCHGLPGCRFEGLFDTLRH